jgi:hypothetical protein
MAKPAVVPELLSALAKGPILVEKAWSGATPALRRFAPAPRKWSIADVVIHLLDTEVANSWRLRHIVGDDDAVVEAFDENAWAKALRYPDLDPKAALTAYAALRWCNVELARRLTKAQLARAGRHTERGPITARWVLERMMQHDAAHLAQIDRNREAFAARGRKRAR